MMMRGVIIGVLFAFCAASVSAQKYPERREARQGNKFYYGGEFESAETSYRRALELRPELKEAAFNLGDALFRQEKTPEAADAWTGIATDSLAETGFVSAANYNLGNAMLAEQKIDEAIEFYKQSLRLNPGDREAKYNLAYAQKLKQQQDEGGGQDDQNQDQDQNDDKPGGGEDDQEQGGDEEQNDEQDDEQPGGGDDPPPPSQVEGKGGSSINPVDAEHMLDAMQAEEDNTREKINAREVRTVGRSGKNW